MTAQLTLPPCCLQLDQQSCWSWQLPWVVPCTPLGDCTLHPATLLPTVGAAVLLAMAAAVAALLLRKRRQGAGPQHPIRPSSPKQGLTARLSARISHASHQNISFRLHTTSSKDPDELSR